MQVQQRWFSTLLVCVVTVGAFRDWSLWPGERRNESLTRITQWFLFPKPVAWKILIIKKIKKYFPLKLIKTPDMGIHPSPPPKKNRVSIVTNRCGTCLWAGNKARRRPLHALHRVILTPAVRHFHRGVCVCVHDIKRQQQSCLKCAKK